MAAAVIPINSAWGASLDQWQHFDLVLGLTADLLPVVSNPNATISSQSAMKGLGKTPSRYNAQRQAVGFPSWTQHVATPDEIAAWSRERDYGLSVQTRLVRALDVDVPDPQQAAAIRDFIATRHQLPTRVRSASSKFLLLFECAGELHKRSFKCEHGIVEWLCTGQQFVALGAHIDRDGVSRSRYEWDGGLPDAIPVLTLEQAERLWSDLVATFGVDAPSESQASVKAQKLADVFAHDPVAQFLLSTNRVKRTERDGRLHITCPFEDEHTTDSGDSATTYFPAHTGGYVNGHVQCLHAHCEHRSDQEFFDAIGYIGESLAGEFAAIRDSDPALVDRREGGASVGSDRPVDGEAPKRIRFQPEQAAAFAQSTPQRWLIKGVLPQAELGVIYGESGAGKSFVTLDMLADLALGQSWRGLKTRQCRVVYVAAEGVKGVRKRLRALAFHREVKLEEMPLWVISDAPNMMEKQDALDVARAIVAVGGADVIVMDTLAQVTPGANENSGEDMGRALAHCRGVHRATGAMVLLIHHSGKDTSRGARGWSGIKGALDVEMEISRADEKRSLFVSKMKDGDDGMEYPFKLRNVLLGFDEDGDEEASCVVEHAGDSVRKAKGGPKGNVEKLVLSVLTDLGGVSNEGAQHPELKEAVRAQLPHDPATGRDRRGERIERAFESLIGSGFLVVSGTTIRLKA